MALGLQKFKVTQGGFLKELHRFDSIKLDQTEGHFACWAKTRPAELPACIS